VIVTSYLLGAQGIEAKIDETAQTEAYYKIDPTTGARLFDANNNLIVAYRGVTAWYVYDGHGNVVGAVNGVTGAFAANPSLDVYGVPRASGTAATKQGYCGSLGHVTDDTGLVYMRARYYDPNVGRFVSEDPSGTGANWLVYANDNPVNMVDQTGKLSMYALGSALGAFLWFAMQFQAGTNPLANAVRWLFGALAAHALYNGLNPSGPIMSEVRSILKANDIAQDTNGYTAAIVGAVAGYSLFLMYAMDILDHSDTLAGGNY
jgi:RHS repeat-associated protein